MVQPIKKLLASSGTSTYYDERWFNMFNQHVPSLKQSERTRLMVIDPNKAYQSRYDLYQFLNDINMPRYMHRLVLLLNGYESPTQFDVSAGDGLLIPDESDVAELHRVYLNTYRS